MTSSERRPGRGVEGICFGGSFCLIGVWALVIRFRKVLDLLDLRCSGPYPLYVLSNGVN
jgi:hypothetical protein